MHHNRWMYRHFHSVHHQLTVPYAFGALYNHPLEGFFLDTLSGAIPALLLDLHPWTATMLFSLGTLKTVDDHCGYTLPWDIFQMIFPNNAAYHDIHHWGKGRMYNFSQPFYIYWDLWMGTDYDMAMKKKEEEKDSKEVPEERVAQKTMEEDKENIRPSQTVKKQWIMTLKPTHGLRHRHSVE
jgi:sphinganine C4-monooxygenase